MTLRSAGELGGWIIADPKVSAGPGKQLIIRPTLIRETLRSPFVILPVI